MGLLKKHLLNVEQGLALSLFILMLMVLSIKPFHIFFVHHEVVIEHNSETKYANPTEQECPICDFEFFVYTAQTEQVLPPVIFFPVQQEGLIKTSKAYLVPFSSLLLRAPPVVNLYCFC